MPTVPGGIPSPQGLSRGNSARSTSTTSRPRRASAAAAVLPAGPAPTTITSCSCIQALRLTGVVPATYTARMVTQSSTPDHIARGKSAEATDLIIERRHRMVQPFVEDRSGTLLDFGCGTGSQTLLFL